MGNQRIDGVVATALAAAWPMGSIRARVDSDHASRSDQLLRSHGSLFTAPEFRAGQQYRRWFGFQGGMRKSHRHTWRDGVEPCDVVKIRMMTGELTRIIPAYKLMLHERSYGRGLPANVSRGIMIAVGELCSYDHSKHLFQRYAVFEEGVFLHVAGSLMAGLCATTLAAPFDIIKTRCMGTNMSLREVLRSIDSPKVLFRGWLPAYLRLAPHALIQFPLLEQMLRWMGLPCF
eukprot:GEMP01068668.1.p1 GENE.GEMP01068668.1~~GEMP01068668.1.p1  ORF type:complete len:232 (+),score=23.71 GEMP01068668.1:489-1184(+)